MQKYSRPCLRQYLAIYQEKLGRTTMYLRLGQPVSGPRFEPIYEAVVTTYVQ